MKIYKFHGIQFKQDELTFAEDGKVREVLQKIAACTGPNATLGELLDVILREQIAESLFGTILKPYAPNILVWLLNRYHASCKGVALSGSAILPHLSNSQVAEVLADFFDLNTSWMRGFSGIVNTLAGNAVPKSQPDFPEQKSQGNIVR